MNTILKGFLTFQTMKLSFKRSILLGLFIFMVMSAYGQVDGDYQTRANGNWNANTTWQVRIGGVWVDCALGDYPGATPGAGTVNILDNRTVTITVDVPNEIAALRINGGGNDSYLQLNSGVHLTVIGETYLNANSNNDEKSILVDAGVFTTGSLNANSSGNNDTRDAYLRISSGEVNVLGDISLNSTNLRTYIRFTGNGTLNVEGNMSGGGITSTAGGAGTATSGTVNYNGTGDQNVGSYGYYNLNTQNSGTKTLLGNITINNNLGIQGTSTLASNTFSITGNNTGTFTMETGTTLTLGNTGSATGVDFPSNFTNANTTLNSGSTVIYQTAGAQNVSGVPTYANLTLATSGLKTMLAALNVAGNLSITGSARLYSNTFQITGNATGTFTMDSGTELVLGNTGNATNVIFPSNFTAPSINLDVNSTVTYQASGANQVVSNLPTYGNLTIATNLSTKTCNGDLSIAGNLSVNGTSTFTMGTTASTWDIDGNVAISGTFNFGTATAKTLNIAGDLSGTGAITMQGALAHNLNLGGSSNAITTLNTTNGSGSVVNYTSASAQQVFASNNYQNLTISGGGTKTLQGSTTVINNLILSAGILQLGDNNLTISNDASDAIQGAVFSSTNMIETNGTGYLVRNASADLPIVYPIGTDIYYSPASIDATSATTGTINVRSEKITTLGSNFLTKFWDVITSTAGKTITATFRYDPAEITVVPTNIFFKPTAGVWQIPTSGTESIGSNAFTITGTTDITNTSTYWTAAKIGTYFSYQTGDWNTPTTWTSDPGGTTQVGSSIPGDGDKVVILSGRTVSLPANIASADLEVNINEGGVLDMGTYAFSDAAGLTELNGRGTLRLASVNFPTAVINTLVNVDGGTTEYYNAADFTLPASQTTYNHLHIDAPGVVATQLNNITLNGDLRIKQGTYRINDNSAARRQLTINGDVVVDNGAFITIGTGNTSSGDITGATTAAPFIDYYDLNSHRIVVNGDFTNNGSVKFTNQTYPVYNAFPGNGMATVYFRGATNSTLTCNGTTDFYNLVLDKGVDQSFSLTVYSSAYSNFRIFGQNTLGGEVGGANPDLRKALWIRTGTLVLQGLTIIPSLSEANSGGSPNGDFYIPANGALTLDGSEVVVLSTADDYREVNVAYGVAAASNAAMGILAAGGTQSFSVYGKFQVNDGYFSTRESGGLITWNLSSGQFVINGGTIDAKQFRSAGGGGGLASYDQSGGTLILRGRFQRNSAPYSSVSDLVNASINTTRATGGLNGALGTFNLNEAANVFTMSGGTIRIYDVSGDGSVAAQQKVFEVLSSTGNINVTGGTLELIPTTGTGTDSPNHIIISNASLGNLTINRASSTSVILLNTYPLTVLSNLNLTSGVFNANSLNVTVGGNFTVANGTTYTPGTNWTSFNGSGSQIFTVNTAATLALKKFKIDKPSGTTLTLAGSQSTISVQDSMMIVLGNLADGGKTINFTTSGTTATSYLYNSGRHTGAGKIVLADDDPQLITGDGNGVFQNLELNNTDANIGPITLGANITVNGVLTFSQDKLFNIGTYNLKLGANASITGASSTRYIWSAGNAGDGGVTKTYSASSTSFVFPLGAASTGHAAAEYTPATISFGTNPTTFGNITVIPVGYEHPNTTNKNRSLTYFWRVKSSGFTLGAASLTHSYNYSENDVVLGADIAEAGYKSAVFSGTTFTWNKGAVTDVDETNNIIGGVGTSLDGVSYIDGEFTAGDDDATDPFGTPTIYYSRINGALAGSGEWGVVTTWSTDPVLKHTGAAAAAVPGINDIVVIGGLDSVYLRRDYTNPWTTNNVDPRSCATLMIESGSALDIGYNTNSSFGIVLSHPNGNGNFRITTSSNSGSTYVFPTGDFSDYNINLGTTELYSTNPGAGTTYYLPNGTTSYGNLILSPLGGSNIIFPNNDLLIYGNLVTRGQNADSWFCPTWDVNYPTAPIARVAKTITINGDLDIQGGALIWYGNGAIRQDFVVYGDVIVAPNSAIDVWSGATNQSIAIGGSLINNTVGTTAGGTTTPRRCDFTLLPVTFFGNNSASVTNTLNNPVTIFETVTVNKGSSQATTLTLNIGGTLTTPTNNWLTLQNGTLRYERTDPSTDFTITTTGTLTIPSTAGLYVNYPNNSSNRNIIIANSNVNTNDLYLNGKLTVIAGNVYIGPTNGTTANNNDIEYSGGGASSIEVQGGRLIVNGQIRRNPATTNGILSYVQSGGDVVINGQAAIASNAKLEICNPGSVFNMSGGTITVVRGGGTTYGDLYIRAESSTVTGGEIIFTQTPAIGPVVDAVQNYILDANVALNDLTITGKTAGTARNATVTILISPLTLNGDLTLTNNRSILDMNANYDIDLTVKGGFTNNGTYNHYSNITTFSGGVQTIAGSSATDFYDLVVNPVTSLSLIRNIDVFNDLILSSGQFLYSTYNINVDGDVVNNAFYDGDAIQGGVILNGTNLQLISGTGTFGRLELDNTNGARINNNITLQKSLRLTSGILDINQYLLTLGINSEIEGSGFGVSKMIASDGAYSNVGLRKYFSIYSGPIKTFTYPMGTSGKYTPADLSYTDNTNVGYVRINNINDNHPGVIDPNNVLDYFWEVESNGIAGFNGNLVLNYKEEDVQVTGANTEVNYIAAALLIPGTSWTKYLDNVDETNNTITFNYSSSSNLSGEYTCGIDPALPNDVPEFTSINDGDWSDAGNWIQTGGDPYVLTGAPNGFIVVIDSDDEVTTDINYASSYRLTINGRLSIPSTTFGHNLGTVDGNGTLYLENATFPAGRFTSFFDCSNNSTLEYGGTGSYTIIADLYSSLPKLHFTGTGTKTLPNKDLTICTQLLIDGPTLSNTTYNRKLTIEGTMERYNTGAFSSGSGAGAIVSFAGSTAQTIGGALGNFTGANDFNHFEINNSAGLTINAVGAIEVAGNLMLTSGNIVTSTTSTLTITNTAINCVTPSGGSSTSYVDGPLSKRINQGDNFLFPVGKGTTLGNKITLSSTQTGTILWTVEFFTPNATYTSMTAPLTYVNSREFWTVSASSGSQAVINLKWDPMSDLTPLMTQNGLSDMRVAQYNTGTSSWDELASSATGNSSNGTVYTNTRVTIPAAGSSNFTTACINVTKPRARLNPSGAVCGDEGIPVVFSGSGLAYNYVITYEKGGALQPAVNITLADIPYTLPTDATGTTYQLISFTYNNPTTPTTGVVDPTIVTSYTVPTTANAGTDQSICGGTTVTLDANSPAVGTGLWTITSGAGGTVEFPTVNNSDFDGTNGTNYVLTWTITNGGCSSSDNVNISFPLLPEKPAAFILSDNTVCQGDNDVDYSVANNPSLTYNWSYTGGLGATISGSGNAIQIDYAVTATSGTVEVYTTNGCGDSDPLELAVTVNTLPVFTVTGSDTDLCDEDLFDLTTTFTSINTDYNIEIVLDGTPVAGSPFTSSDNPYDYSENFAWNGPAVSDTHSFMVTVTDKNGCVSTTATPITFDVWKKPETGPQYHVPNTFGF